MRVHHQRAGIDQHVKLPRAGFAQQNIARRRRCVFGQAIEAAHGRPAIEPIEATAAQPIVAGRIDGAPDPFERSGNQADAIQTRRRITPMQAEGAADQIPRGGGKPLPIVHVRRSQSG